MIVFVCSGNICRSPMAEAIARQLEVRHGSTVEFASAGTHAMDGGPATPEAQRVSGELGLALRWHKSRPLDRTVVAGADLLVALDQEHFDFIERAYPDARVELLDRVPDPYGESLSTYRAVRDQIAVAIEKRAGRWLNAD